MDDMPPRVIIRPDGAAPVTVPDELRAEWDNMPIWREQEYIRADLAAAALEAKDAEIARLRGLVVRLYADAGKWAGVAGGWLDDDIEADVAALQAKE